MHLVLVHFPPLFFSLRLRKKKKNKSHRYYYYFHKTTIFLFWYSFRNDFILAMVNENYGKKINFPINAHTYIVVLDQKTTQKKNLRKIIPNYFILTLFTRSWTKWIKIRLWCKKKIGQNWIMYKKIIWKIFIKSINIISFFVNLNTLIYVNTRYAYKITGIFLFNWMVSVSFFKRWGGFIRFSYIYVLSSLIVCVFQKEKTSVGINKYSRMSIVYVCLFSQLFAAI